MFTVALKPSFIYLFFFFKKGVFPLLAYSNQEVLEKQLRLQSLVRRECEKEYLRLQFRSRHLIKVTESQ